MKSGQVVGGIIVGSIIGAAFTMTRPGNKAMSRMRKGLKMIKL